MPHKDPEVRKAFQQNYRKTHAADRREYRQVNSTRINASNQKYANSPRGKAKSAAAGVRWSATAKGKAYHKARHLSYTYGLTLLQHDAVLNFQDGLCAVCKIDPPVDVDHDHKTNEVRGLLCHKCNVAIGLLRDDPTLMRAAASYVETDPKHIRIVKQII